MEYAIMCYFYNMLLLVFTFIVHGTCKLSCIKFKLRKLNVLLINVQILYNSNRLMIMNIAIGAIF